MILVPLYCVMSDLHIQLSSVVSRCGSDVCVCVCVCVCVLCVCAVFIAVCMCVCVCVFTFVVQ